MRQRAAAAAAASATTTPPRSADSDHSWQNHPAVRHHRNSYQGAVREEPVQDSRSMRDAYGPVAGAGGDASEGHARRRRTAATTAHPLHNSTNTNHHHQQQLLHSPQHYISEYNKNYGIDISGTTGSSGTHIHHSTANSEVSAPRSTGGLAYSGRSHSQRDMYDPNATASDVYYAQYANHYPSHQQHSYGENLSRPTNLRRTNSTGTTTSRNAHKASFQHFEATFHLDPNPIAAVHFRKALHVPDKQYREYLHGKGRDSTPILNPICCANLCAGFSMVGFIFLFFIGILLDTQPLLIGGTLPSATKENDSGKTSTIYFLTAERLPMASNAYQTSYAYLATALACLIYVYYERLDSMVKRRSYQDVPDAISPGGGGGGGSSSVVGVIDGDYDHPDGGDEVDGGNLDAATRAAAYKLSKWNRLASAASSGTVRLREWAGTAAARVWNGRGGINARGTRPKQRSKACAKTV